MKNPMTEQDPCAGHVLPDVLRPGLQIVFCGTAPGTVSAQQQAYYAGPGNKFWPTLFEVGLTPHRFAPAQYPELLKLGIGLTDLVKTTFGADLMLTRSDFGCDELQAKMIRYQPRILAFTSKRAGREFLGHTVEYGMQEQQVGDTRIFVLPSPSGLARGFWSHDPWQELANLKKIQNHCSK